MESAINASGSPPNDDGGKNDRWVVSLIAGLIGLTVASFFQPKNPGDPAVAQSATTEQKKSSLRDPIVWATVGMFVATAVSAGVGIAQWHALSSTDEATHIAANAAKKSADAALQQSNTLVTSQRPWIDIVDIKIANDIIFDANGARITVQFKLVNTGQTPGMRVEPQFNPILLKTGGVKNDFDNIQSSGVFGDVVFPGNDTAERTMAAYIPRADVDSVEKGKGRIFDLMARVCATYDFPFIDPTNVRHITCYVFTITQANGYLLSIPDPEAPIPKTSIGGKRYPGGSFAN
jgi:hypothetical protein